MIWNEVFCIYAESLKDEIVFKYWNKNYAGLPISYLDEGFGWSTAKLSALCANDGGTRNIAMFYGVTKIGSLTVRARYTNHEMI